MTLHAKIKEEIKEAMRAKDTVRLETLRGLNALFLNEIIMGKSATGESEFLPDDKALALVKRSVKQRKDSIEQFTKGNRPDLVQKEKAELVILESFLPASLSRDEIRKVAVKHIEALKSAGNFDPKSIGKLTGLVMKELAGKADGNDVKTVIEELTKPELSL